MQCRICHSKSLTKFLDLGHTPTADDFLSPNRLTEPEVYYPLEAFICNGCSLVQIGYVVPPEMLFNETYPYESSTTKTGVAHFHSLAQEAVSRFRLTQKDLVVDIGSNVGVLLQGFKNQGIVNVLGVEPVRNIGEIAIKRGIETIHDFFSEALSRTITKERKKAKVVTGTNVVAHINDLHSLVRALDILLDDDGVFIFEAPYLVDLIENLEYDTIYHEHLSYLSVKPVSILFHTFGMEIFDVEKVDIHGGSLRYFVARKNAYPISSNVDKFLELEKEKRIYEHDTLKNFATSVQHNREELIWMLKSIKHEGKRIAGVSAPAKGMTLLNYCRIGPEILDFVTEKSTLKIGKYTPGTHIPVLPDSELIKQKPDYALLLAWNFADEIIKNLKNYKDAGGKFIIPIPKPHIID
ncbi:class I SAM-dependent methyltransferase [Halobacteriota archaeon]